MTILPSLPAELIHEILSHIQPAAALHKCKISEESRWSTGQRHQTLATIARTCRTLRDIAVPLLYSRYEASFHNPVIPFVDRFTAEPESNRDLRYVKVCKCGTNDFKYSPAQERLFQYHAWAMDSELKSYGISETRELTSDEASEVELWRLISRAPNLELLDVPACAWHAKSDLSPDEPPMWLFPIVSAAQGVIESEYSGCFQKLHSLDINMQGECGTWLVPLLSLPCLRSLCLRSWGRQPYDDWEVSLVWPEPTATSSVCDLSFTDVSVPADVIVRIFGFCKALKSFKCWGAFDKSMSIFRDQCGRQWCTEILEGLQQHKQTLSSLALDPYEGYWRRYMATDLSRVQGFRELVALQSLDVPWNIVMGSPSGVRDEQTNSLRPADDWQYPEMRDVLPRNLRHFKTDLSDHTLIGYAGLEEAMCSARPLESWDDGTVVLKTIDLVYNNAHHYKDLPMNFWRIQDAYHKAGCTFTYHLKLDPHDLMWIDPAAGYEKQLSDLARKLANEGPPGVQMAVRAKVIGLPRRVMRFLGLGKDWLDTEEAKEILFGEQFDYYAYNSDWESPRSDEPRTSVVQD